MNTSQLCQICDRDMVVQGTHRKFLFCDGCGYIVEIKDAETK
jgi:Fe2+ or Zn2+ uptake regulation protein